MNMNKKILNYSDVKSGFTMVELSLTMAFVAVLLITIAVITSNIMTIYQKGLTIKAVNSVGRGLTDEFITGITSAPAVDTTSLCNSHITDNKNKCEDEQAFNFVFQEYRPTSGDFKDKQLYGVFCTGNYSYLWNTYYGEKAGKTITIKYKIRNDAGGEEDVIAYDINDKKPTPTQYPRLVRFKDPTYRLCSAVTDKNYKPLLKEGGTTEINITQLRNADGFGFGNNVLPEKPEQGMLDAFDLDLELYDLTVYHIAQDPMTLRTYIPGSFILATKRGNIDISRSGDYCQPDSIVDAVTGEVTSGDTSSLSDLGSEFNYCAINKFNFAARTAGVD